MAPCVSLQQGQCSHQPSFATEAGSLGVCAQHQKYSQPETIEDTNSNTTGTQHVIFYTGQQTCSNVAILHCFMLA